MVVLGRESGSVEKRVEKKREVPTSDKRTFVEEQILPHSMIKTIIKLFSHHETVRNLEKVKK